jgi:hypothetical protein
MIFELTPVTSDHTPKTNLACLYIEYKAISKMIEAMTYMIVISIVFP